MAEFAHRVRLFLSSPGDLSNQRDLIGKVCELLSKDLGASEHFYIDLLRWETHSYSAIGQSPQELINKQIGDDYEIFLGMFGNRFGTATNRFGSGTEEEFHRAVDRFKKTGTPEIMFLFFDGKASLSSIDPEQLGKVQAFRNTLSKHGILYASFDDELSLHRLAYSQILKTVRNVLSKDRKTPDCDASTVNNLAFDPLFEWNQLLAQDAEVRASILMQQAAKSIVEFNSKMVRLTKANGNLLRTLGTEVPKLAKGGLARPDFIVGAFKRVVESVQNSNSAYLEILPGLYDQLMSTISLCQRSLSIFRSRGEFTKEIAEANKAPLMEFVASLDVTKKALETMQHGLATDNFPGTPLSVEQKKLRALTRDLSRILDAGIREGMELVSMFEQVQQEQ